MTLIERLSKLDGPCGHYTAMDMAIHSPFKNKERELFIEALNGSVDAAIALAERVLPSKSMDLLREAISELGKKYHWHICRKKPEQTRELPIQLCIAILRAKEASHDQ